MRKTIILTAVAVGLVLAACSKPTQEKTSADLKAVGSDMSAASKDVVHSDAVTAVGSDIKQGAAEAGDKTRDAADKAGEKLKAAGSDLGESARKAGADIKAGARKADAKVDDAVNK